MKKEISIIIPCYKSEKNIQRVTSEIISEIQDKYMYRIILVNDYSPDNTEDIIMDLAEKNKNIIVISLSKNYGQQAARMAAISMVKGDYVVFMDDDGQHNPKGIEKLLNKMDEGYDIVYAKFQSNKETKFRQWGSSLNTKMTNWLMGKPKDVKQSSFFSVRRFVVEELRKYRSPYPYLFGYFMQITQNIANIDIIHEERISGETGYNLKKLITMWVNGFVGFSIIPLRIADALGLGSASIGFLLAAILAVKKIIEPSIIIGYTSTMVALLVVGGIILLMLGLLGEYVGRILMTVNGIPQYTIKSIKNGGSDT